MHKTTLLIADGHEIMRESLAVVLGREQSIEVVGVVPDGRSAIATANSIKPDAALLDVALPQINGIQAARQIRVDSPGTGLVLLSAHDRGEYMRDFMKEDSTGKAFLLKHTLNSTADLVRVVEDVAHGRTILDPAMVSKLTSGDNFKVAASLNGLSPRELQVLALMARAHSNRSIAEALFIQPRTVEHHISSILAKLGFNADGERHGRVHAILTYLDVTGQLPLQTHDAAEPLSQRRYAA